MLNTIIKLIFCHMVGDYGLQSEYIATSKGDNWYHMIVHCILYCLPFYVIFGLTWHLKIIFVSHIIIDSLKARYKSINYVDDQILHFTFLLLYFF